TRGTSAISPPVAARALLRAEDASGGATSSRGPACGGARRELSLGRARQIHPARRLASAPAFLPVARRARRAEWAPAPFVSAQAAERHGAPGGAFGDAGRRAGG